MILAPCVEAKQLFQFLSLDLGFFFHLNTHSVCTELPKKRRRGWVFRNQIFFFEKVFSTQHGLMLHLSSGLNNGARERESEKERAMWSCTALAA